MCADVEALLRLRGEARIVGQTCIKYVGVRVLNGKIRELVMKEPQVKCLQDILDLEIQKEHQALQHQVVQQEDQALSM